MEATATPMKMLPASGALPSVVCAQTVYPLSTDVVCNPAHKLLYFGFVRTPSPRYIVGQTVVEAKATLLDLFPS